ncbi:DNA integrity scanning diadenylate cyclase DisA [Ornithinimicrobium sp. Arc0846-15]|nr:DNA integrity scanning diadenylate cyclase DisA [Ornithinimicrobium laminariae]
MSNEGPTDQEVLRSVIAAIAPGTELRDGLDRILRGRTGAMIVLGDDDAVTAISTGGFQLDIEFSATRLRELAKMDGAIVLDRAGSKIVRAATQLVPDPTIQTRESGTRHRTAERVAKQTRHPVVSVSQSMAIVAIYVGDVRYVLEDSGQILARSNQALQTLERYRSRFDEVAGSLSALEIEDLVTVRDVASVLQRLEMVSRISREIEQYAVELGADGRLISLQLAELTGGIGNDRELVARDYTGQGGAQRSPSEILACLGRLSGPDLLDLAQVARCMGFSAQSDALDTSVSPRGYRLLGKVPRLPIAVATRLITHFGTLQALLAAGVGDLTQVDGVGEHRARTIREGLSRLAETSILERYV